MRASDLIRKHLPASRLLSRHAPSLEGFLDPLWPWADRQLRELVKPRKQPRHFPAAWKDVPTATYTGDRPAVMGPGRSYLLPLRGAGHEGIVPGTSEEDGNKVAWKVGWSYAPLGAEIERQLLDPRNPRAILSPSLDRGVALVEARREGEDTRPRYVDPFHLALALLAAGSPWQARWDGNNRVTIEGPRGIAGVLARKASDALPAGPGGAMPVEGLLKARGDDVPWTEKDQEEDIAERKGVTLRRDPGSPATPWRVDVGPGIDPARGWSTVWSSDPVDAARIYRGVVPGDFDPRLATRAAWIEYRSRVLSENGRRVTRLVEGDPVDMKAALRRLGRGAVQGDLVAIHGKGTPSDILSWDGEQWVQDADAAMLGQWASRVKHATVATHPQVKADHDAYLARGSKARDPRRADSLGWLRDLLRRWRAAGASDEAIEGWLDAAGRVDASDLRELERRVRAAERGATGPLPRLLPPGSRAIHGVPRQARTRARATRISISTLLARYGFPGKKP